MLRENTPISQYCSLKVIGLHGLQNNTRATARADVSGAICYIKVLLNGAL